MSVVNASAIPESQYDRHQSPDVQKPELRIDGLKDQGHDQRGRGEPILTIDGLREQGHDQRGRGASDDAPTSKGDSTPSSAEASLDGWSTPQFTQTREEAPRWSDIMSEEEDDEDLRPRQTKASRRRRRRGQRKKAMERAIEQEKQAKRAELLGDNPAADDMDRAVVTLSDLGILMSTPAAATNSRQHGKELADVIREPGCPQSPTGAQMGVRRIAQTSPTWTNAPGATGSSGHDVGGTPSLNHQTYPPWMAPVDPTGHVYVAVPVVCFPWQAVAVPCAPDVGGACDFQQVHLNTSHAPHGHLLPAAGTTPPKQDTAYNDARSETTEL